MNNLRDQGYPSSMDGYIKRFKIKTIEKRPSNLIMNDSIPINVIKRGWDGTFVPEKQVRDNWLKGAVDLYNSLKSSNEMPTLNYIGRDEFDNQNRPVRSISGVEFESADHNRKGFLQKDMMLKNTKYSGSINGLNNLLGDNKFQKSFDSRFGRVTGVYDGDSLYGTLTRPSTDYYLNALNLLLNRGKL